MSVTPQVSINGGAASTGAVAAAAGDTIQPTAASYATWGSPVARWEIYDYPAAFTAPAGWSSSGSGDTLVFYWLGNSAPPSFVADERGSYLIHVTATEGNDPTLAKVMVDIPLANGMKQICRGEGELYGGTKLRWTKKAQENLVVIDGQLSSDPYDYAWAGTVTPDWNNSHTARIGALTAAVTIANGTNPRDGARYVFETIQDGTGTWAITWGAKYKFPNGRGYNDRRAGIRTIWVFVYNAADDEYHCTSRSMDPGSSGIVVHTGASPVMVPGFINVLESTVTGTIRVPAAASWGGSENIVTIKLDNLTGGATVDRAASPGTDTINGGASYVIAEVYGQVVMFTNGAGKVYSSPGLT